MCVNMSKLARPGHLHAHDQGHVIGKGKVCLGEYICMEMCVCDRTQIHMCICAKLCFSQCTLMRGKKMRSCGQVCVYLGMHREV